MLGRGEAGRDGQFPRSGGAAYPWPDSGRELPARLEQPSTWRRERKRWRAGQRERASAGRLAPAGPPVPAWRRAWARLRHGRPGWLAVRIIAAAAVPLTAELAAPGNPAVPALAVGAGTWLVLTARFDLAPHGYRNAGKG